MLKVKLKKYTKYKKTDIDWIGEIPDHWENRKIQHIFSIKKDIAGKTGFNVLSITQKGVKIKDLSSNDGQLSLNYAKYQLVKKGDFAMNHMDLLTGFVDISKFNGVTSPDYRVFELTDDNSNDVYMLFLLQMCYTEKIFYPLGRGAAQYGRWRLGSNEFKSFRFPIPPLQEQTTITTYLNHKTALIDKLIEGNEKQIKLLEEKRKATINQAVTKGLDPNAKMKDSGVEWIGEIPEGWEVKKLKWICDINPSKSEVSNLDKSIEITFLPMEDVFETGTFINNKIRKLNDVYSGFTYFRDGDVLLAKITPCFENGKTAYIENLTNGIGFGSTEYHVLRSSEDVYPEFIHYVIRSHFFREPGKSFMTGSAGQKRVPTDYLSEYKLGLPTIKNQKEIVEHLNQKTQNIDLLVVKIKKQNILLKEYRQSLISHVVTGKVDVRDEVKLLK